MRVDGRDIVVSGDLLQPLTRRTNDILRLVSAGAFLVIVVTSSLILLDVSPYWQDVIKGLILLAAVTIDHLLNSRKTAR